MSKDNTEKSSKAKETMLNCDSITFLKYANMYRNDIEDFLKQTDINNIRNSGQKLTGDETEGEKKEIEKKNIREKWDKIFKACFVENMEITLDIIAKIYMTTVDELKKMSPIEIQNALILILADDRINGFFMALKLWGLSDMES